MNKVFCDWCGKEMKWDKRLEIYQPSKIDIELCKECSKEIREIIKKRK